MLLNDKLTMTNQLKSARAQKQVSNWPLLSFALYVLVLFAIRQVNAYITFVGFNSKECYFEKALAGTTLEFTYEITVAGPHSIEVSITDPKGITIYDEPKASSGRHTIQADKNGPYNFCFSNGGFSGKLEEIMFNIETVNQTQRQLSNEQPQEKVDRMFEELITTLISVKHQLDYLLVRDRVHREINEATNSHVTYWTWGELLILICVSFGQAVYIKRFFEVRRII